MYRGNEEWRDVTPQPSGRWLSRDPIEETGFRILRLASKSQKTVLNERKKAALLRIRRIMDRHDLPVWIQERLAIVARILANSEVEIRRFEKPNSRSLYLFNNNSSVQYIDLFGLVCGSGSTDMLVPDTLPYLFDFTQACQNHDNCYGNTVDCPSKEQCDSQFLQDMLGACGFHPPCWAFAFTYAAAVTSVGGLPFNAARAGSCCDQLPPGQYYPPGFGPGTPGFTPPDDDDDITPGIPVIIIPLPWG